MLRKLTTDDRRPTTTDFLGFLIFLSVVGCGLLVGANQALSHGGVDDAELIIRMNDNGFEPKELTVVEGDEVLFINNDDVDRWPASNFHPTHTLYPEFDPLEGIKPGASWKMKFEEVGTHRMHDHLIPHMTGTIVVLEDPGEGAEGAAENTPDNKERWWSRIKAFFLKLFKKPVSEAKAVDATVLSEFKALNERDKYAWLEALSKRDGPASAWQYVLAAYTTPEGVVGSAHDMAHLVGQLLFKEAGLNGLSVCTPVFAFGCYHGLMEVAFHGKDAEDYTKSLFDAQMACGALGDENHPPYWSCIHGMGHGVVTYREHDVAQALKDCDVLEEAVRTYCYDGVFMELSISAVPSFYKKDDPLYPCNAIEEKYQFTCARSQPNVMRSKFNLDTGEIARVCEQSGSNAIFYHCIESLGFYMGQTSGNDANKIVRGCGEIESPSGKNQCLAAAAGELVFQNTAGWQSSAPAVCASLMSPSRKECLDRIERVKKSYGR
jgi:plastocyanin